jgi:hypothetical protein
MMDGKSLLLHNIPPTSYARANVVESVCIDGVHILLVFIILIVEGNEMCNLDSVRGGINVSG